MNFTPSFGTVQGGQGTFNPQKSNFQTGPLANRREEKGAEKDIFNQARMFKRLHEDTLQINQILTRASTLTSKPATTSDPKDKGSEYGARYHGFSYGLGHRTGGYLAGLDKGSSAQGETRSIDQLFQNLKQKTESMRLDAEAENESKAFFASKNIDLTGIEYSLK
jgi:hypothetical protein